MNTVRTPRSRASSTSRLVSVVAMRASEKALLTRRQPTPSRYNGPASIVSSRRPARATDANILQRLFSAVANVVLRVRRLPTGRRNGRVGQSPCGLSACPLSSLSQDGRERARLRLSGSPHDGYERSDRIQPGRSPGLEVHPRETAEFNRAHRHPTETLCRSAWQSSTMLSISSSVSSPCFHPYSVVAPWTLPLAMQQQVVRSVVVEATCAICTSSTNATSLGLEHPGAQLRRVYRRRAITPSSRHPATARSRQTAVEDQATDRAFRNGQHKNVFVGISKFVSPVDPRVPVLNCLLRFLIDLDSRELSKRYSQRSVLPPDVHEHLVLGYLLRGQADHIYALPKPQRRRRTFSNAFRLKWKLQMLLQVAKPPKSLFLSVVCVRDDLEGKALIKVVVILTTCHEVALPLYSVDDPRTSCNASAPCTERKESSARSSSRSTPSRIAWVDRLSSVLRVDPDAPAELPVVGADAGPAPTRGPR